MRQVWLLRPGATTTELTPIEFAEPIYDVCMGPNRNFDATELRLHYHSMTTPRTVVDIQTETPTLERTVRRFRVYVFLRRAPTCDHVHCLLADGPPPPTARPCTNRRIWLSDLLGCARRVRRCALAQKQIKHVKEVPKYTATDYESVQLYAAARDGKTRVPMCAVFNKKLRGTPDGAAELPFTKGPVLLYGCVPRTYHLLPSACFFFPSAASSVCVCALLLFTCELYRSTVRSRGGCVRCSADVDHF